MRGGTVIPEVTEDSSS